MPAPSGKTQIGLIGLGIMGAPMALNLLKAGFQLKAYNRSDRPRVRQVAEAGAVLCASPREVAAASDNIITMVTDTTVM